MAELILVVEDEPALRETLLYNLEKQGYRVEAVGDGMSALESARRLKPDLLLLDLMLPLLDGFEVCKILRRESDLPILILTARDDEIDRVVGLEIGADDYMVKPFSMRELLARVKAHLRRSELLREEVSRLRLGDPATAHEILTFDNLEINLTRSEVRLGGDVLPLKPQEYALLIFFAGHRRQMLSRDFILERVWGWEYVGNSRTVDVHVRWLREKIEKDPADPKRIVTVRGGGYIFEG
jgi:DNA-binding response OmpR family regulator